ncbi:hypothetical protein HELRODRAFT_80019, partial [Helobdella robusta]|uniref:Bardet-Biedl syndrome 7 protein homolog n=1 Tax=Helobdella robusta TaxID=6412 RepID=T1G3W6_HELRO
AIFRTNVNCPVTCLELGGKLGQEKNVVFVATVAGKVMGFTKKGKQFMNLDSDMSEPVKSMHVEAADLLLAGEYTLRHFNNCVEVHFYLCPDKINDVISLPPLKYSGKVFPVLACSDKTLKVLSGSDMVGELNVSGIPVVLNMYHNNGGPNGELVLYGTDDGKFGLSLITPICQSVLWELSSPASLTKKVIGLLTFDLETNHTSGAFGDLIIGYDNGGLVEVYGLSDDEMDKPVHKGSFSLNESLRSIGCGRFNNADHAEILCLTFSGWVVGLTTEPSSHALNKDSGEHDIKMEILRKEIENLERQVEIEKEKYQSNSQKPDLVSQGQEIEVKLQFHLNPDEGVYGLNLETVVPIEYIMLQCDVPIDVIDMDKNSSIVSFTPCSNEEENFLLATYRCQANTTKLELKVIPVEGHQGHLRAYVVPLMKPKLCQVKQLAIKPLCMHFRDSNKKKRSRDIDSESNGESRPMNRLTMQGNVSLSDIHSWVNLCFWGIPEKVPADEKASYGFVSSCLGTVFNCSYRDGMIECTSDNLSTMNIFKDLIFKEATKSGIKLDISFDINDETVINTLKSIIPKMDELILAAQKVQLIEGLKEIETQEGSIDCLTGDFKQVLIEADLLTALHKQKHKQLERYYAMITHLYQSWFKFKGRSVKDKLDGLQGVIKKHDSKMLLEFFKNST